MREKNAGLEMEHSGGQRKDPTSKKQIGCTTRKSGSSGLFSTRPRQKRSKTERNRMKYSFGTKTQIDGPESLEKTARDTTTASTGKLRQPENFPCSPRPSDCSCSQYAGPIAIWGIGNKWSHSQCTRWSASSCAEPFEQRGPRKQSSNHRNESR
jgi:hypothetical protein